MKIALIALLFALAALAQAQTAGLPAACGPKDSSFDVKLDKSQQTPAPPEPGKARVYFIQNLGPRNFIAVINVGLDGAWVGANKDNSYFSVSVVPGGHHVCENVKSHFSVYGRLVEFADFTAEAGKVYYFRARLSFGENQPSLELEPVDSDQAKYLIASYPLSVSRPKK
jgi:hypothetical protein